jgi:hypothetical protein
MGGSVLHWDDLQGSIEDIDVIGGP